MSTTQLKNNICNDKKINKNLKFKCCIFVSIKIETRKQKQSIATTNTKIK